MPTHTKLYFEPETVKAASEIPGVIGLKDSSANMVYFYGWPCFLAGNGINYGAYYLLHLSYHKQPAR